MLRSVSIHLMWTGLAFPERVAAAARSGFDLVDLWDWRDSDIDGVATQARRSAIGIDGFFGVRDTSLVDPGERSRFLEELKRSLDVAVKVGARQLHVFSNAIRPGGVVVPSPPLSPAGLEEACLDGLSAAAELVAGTGVVLALESLNPVYLPGYLWVDVAQTISIARQIGRPAEVGVVFDAFHQQLSTGRLAERLGEALPWLVRVDVAEVPGRREPGAGEIDFRYLRNLIDDAGWDGIVSFETVPSDGRPETAVAAIDEIFPPSWAGAPRSPSKREP